MRTSGRRTTQLEAGGGRFSSTAAQSAQRKLYKLIRQIRNEEDGEKVKVLEGKYYEKLTKITKE